MSDEIDYTKIPEILTVNIRTPDKIIFEGKCKAVVAENIIGPFAVFPGHQNFITNITGKISIKEIEGKKGDDKNLDLTIHMGILRVRLNELSCYLMLYSEGESGEVQGISSGKVS